ncbi:MAG: hypothetical protein DRG50_09505 [Deltaproteobacteria bacterium]|nr:MAG: hypothetical protein DRG50_09505 [Deltaproteobacteria bacterium]
MTYSYFPGCSLKGTAKGLEEGLVKIFSALGDKLVEIPEWNCCGAFEFGAKEKILALSSVNIEKGRGISEVFLVPCPACFRNLKEAKGTAVSILHPLEVLSRPPVWDRLNTKRDLKGVPFTPYYGCILLRPKEFALQADEPMEEVILRLGGKIGASQVKSQCCGGNLFFKELEVVKRLANKVLDGAERNVVTFCPLCYLVLRTFSNRDGHRIFYLTDLILYAMGEEEIEFFL